MDVGDSEGHRMPFVVQTIAEDGDTPWYVKFCIGLRGNLSHSQRQTQPSGSYTGGEFNIYILEFKLGDFPLVKRKKWERKFQ